MQVGDLLFLFQSAQIHVLHHGDDMLIRKLLHRERECHVTQLSDLIHMRVRHHLEAKFKVSNSPKDSNPIRVVQDHIHDARRGFSMPSVKSPQRAALNTGDTSATVFR